MEIEFIVAKMTDLIKSSGKTLVVADTYRRSKNAVKAFELREEYEGREYKTKHDTGSWSVHAKDWELIALPVGERKICGYRFDNVIMDRNIPEDVKREIIMPMMAVSKGGWILIV
jgi:hypothetical protein